MFSTSHRFSNQDKLNSNNIRIAIKVHRYYADGDGKLKCKVSSSKFKRIGDLTIGDVVVFATKRTIEPELFICVGKSKINEHGIITANVRELPVDELLFTNPPIIKDNIEKFIDGIGEIEVRVD